METKIKKSRVILLYILVTLAWCAVVYRLFEIQIVHGREYGEKALKQSTGKVEVKAERGLIFDRKGRQVAVNVIRNSLYAYPSGRLEINKIHGYLDRLYNKSAGSSRRKYHLKSGKFRWIDRELSDGIAAAVKRDSVPGLYIRKELQRDYPFPDVGRQLLGCTDIDSRGLSGLEFGCDSILSGRPGLIDYLRDAHRNTYRIKEIPLIEPVPGHSIVLTVDWYFQEIVEEELKTAVEEYDALEGSAIFLDCNTGEILAAADYIAGGKTDAVKLRAVSNCFEPGSAFKVFTTAALIEENLVDAEEKIECGNGIWKVGRRILHDDKKYDSLNFQEIFELSSNIGMAKLAQRLGGEKLLEIARRFGFGEMCFVGLPGEQSGSIGQPGVWSEYNIASLSIGHAISVTPLQLVAAAAAVANGGRLYRPSIIRGIINNEGKLIKKDGRELIARVIKAGSAERLRSFMVGVVERGTATPVCSDIVSIAGKTGTAEVPDLENGGYMKNKFTASFLGFFPAEKPRVAGIVVLHQPEPIHYGGYTAGPAFRKMAERYAIANSEFLRPESRLCAESDRSNMKEIPDLVGRDISLAYKIAEEERISLATNDTSGLVIWQYPPEGRRIPGSDIVAIIAQRDDNSPMTMLDFSGMKVRTAMAVLDYQDIDFEIVGDGMVIRQYPPPGALLDMSGRCRLVCGSN
jgi:cell division protein FtsI/penicillin-binding protein 2